MAQVNVHEAKTHLSRRLERAHAGEEILVSSASVWEIATKHRIGKLGGVEPLLADM